MRARLFGFIFIEGVPRPAGSRRALFRQSDSLSELREARVGVEVVEARVGGQVNGHKIGALLVSVLKPGEGLICFSQPRIDDGVAVRSDVAVRRQRFQMIDHLLRFGPVPRQGIGVTQACGVCGGLGSVRASGASRLRWCVDRRHRPSATGIGRRCGHRRPCGGLRSWCSRRAELW
jgi:hypothetical protein